MNYYTIYIFRQIKLLRTESLNTVLITQSLTIESLLVTLLRFMIIFLPPFPPENIWSLFDVQCQRS